ncbi:kinase-like domain-containing protein [Chytridium lagenaria]|nr:kinase-like domain-containing protein [Chytridium lagenaria]
MASSTAVIPASAVAIDTSAVIGSGAVGVVYKARYANETVVVKRLKLTALSDSSKSEFLQEAKTLASLNHPRIVRFLGVILDDSQYSIVLEYLPLGSLYSFYTSSPKLPYALRLSLASDVAAGMTFLHRCDPPVLHRDMKSLNILMYVDASGELHCKITDFGIAIVRQSAVTTTSALSDASEGSQAKGTLVWMAPELHNLRAVYRFACDVYSFGIVLSELFSWLGPFGIPTSELRSEVLLHMLTVQKQVPEVELDEDCPASLLTLVESCVSLDPSLRPSFDAINRTLNTLSEGLTIPFASEVGVGVKPLLATMVATTNFDVTETAMHTNSGSGSLSPSSSFDRFNSSTSSERFNLNQPSPTTSGPRNISAPYTPVPVPMSIPAASIPAANIPAANYTPQSVYDMANASYIPYEASYTPAASYTPPAAPYVPAASSYTSPYIQPYPQPYPHSTPANNNRSSIPAYSAYPSTTPSTSSVSPAVYEFSPPKTKKSMSGSTKAVIIVITVLILAGAGVGLYIALRPKPVDAPRLRRTVLQPEHQPRVICRQSNRLQH